MTENTETKSTLGTFLKAARERLSPEDLGFVRGRRRTPGLRREEVAQLCEISTTWYTWLEQGRTESVSSQILVKITRALRLSQAERSYLFKLAHQANENTVTEFSQQRMQHWQDLVNKINAPSYIMDRHWDLLVWNSLASDLFKGWLDLDIEHNLLRFLFFNPVAKELTIDWQQRAERIVAEYRADSANWHYDKVHLALVDELCSTSDQFKTAWHAEKVSAREGGLRQFNCNGKTVSYQQSTLRMADHYDIKMVVLQPLNNDLV